MKRYARGWWIRRSNRHTKIVFFLALLQLLISPVLFGFTFIWEEYSIFIGSITQSVNINGIIVADQDTWPSTLRIFSVTHGLYLFGLSIVCLVTIFKMNTPGFVCYLVYAIMLGVILIMGIALLSYFLVLIERDCKNCYHCVLGGNVNDSDSTETNNRLYDCRVGAYYAGKDCSISDSACDPHGFREVMLEFVLISSAALILLIVNVVLGFFTCGKLKKMNETYEASMEQIQYTQTLMDPERDFDED